MSDLVEKVAEVVTLMDRPTEHDYDIAKAAIRCGAEGFAQLPSRLCPRERSEP